MQGTLLCIGKAFIAQVWSLLFETIKNRELREGDKDEEGMKNKLFKEELDLFRFKRRGGYNANSAHWIES